MRINLSNNRLAIYTLFLLIVISSSCKKSPKPDITDNPTDRNGGLPAVGTRTQLTLDSLFLYAKQIYYWSDAIPAYDAFNPRQYSSKSKPIDNYDDELFAISNLKLNPATGKPFEYNGYGYPKYSRIDDLTQANPNATSAIKTANVDVDNNGYDVGIRPIFYLFRNSDKYQLFVTAVYPGSPAETAGVKRGWLITKVNGQTVGASYTNENETVFNSFSAASVTIEGYNSIDKVPFSLTLNRASYKSNPVYTAKVIARSGKKIGYLAYARFARLSSNTGASDASLDPVFADFSAQGVTDLIIDLRYNGGGYVNAASYLTNLIGPSSTSGKTMFTEIYNPLMQAGNATILANQPLLDGDGKIIRQNGKIVTAADDNYSVAANTITFSKKGSLSGVNNVVFIVTRNTASASEIVINSLKPYMNVKLVGDTTYGKPVGFFPIVLENRYQVYMPIFETRNSKNEGGYYTGMVPDVLDEYDDPEYVFGDVRENYLAKALNVLAPSVTATQGIANTETRRASTVEFKGQQIRKVNPNSEFVGMIETRHSRKR
ncbi:Carboxyl-terminal protease [Pedobacter cryoconitis]|uniref:Carboxyl-terminal protease n=1 Tax=Pedobacter cryoconitis TaxID=188932 RepID=A0A127V7E1_9SPHI|nr:S41 family peptidase [Pedobacter cryoconitis]AMP97292.1 Carboxyl-terminal protease [Pedobacter cryoconitis]